MESAKKLLIFILYLMSMEAATAFLTALSNQQKDRVCHGKILCLDLSARDLSQYRLYSPRTTRVVLHALPSEDRPGTARFSGVEFTSTFDFILGLIASDVGSIALGLIGLLLVVGLRLSSLDELASSPETLEYETRLDLLAVFACGAVLVNGVSKLDVTSAMAETVKLHGVQVQEATILSSSLSSTTTDIKWAMDSFLAATPAKSVVILSRNTDSTVGGAWQVAAMMGVLPSESPTLPPSSPILDRFQTNTSKETYLPTLQNLPGKTEFTYLPANTQEVLLLPVSDEGVVALGSDTAKSFTPRDIAWCQALASRLGVGAS